jgi:hypothetical protein
MHTGNKNKIKKIKVLNEINKLIKVNSSTRTIANKIKIITL